MKNGVKDAKGNIVGKISDTTRGIYLRLTSSFLPKSK